MKLFLTAICIRLSYCERVRVYDKEGWCVPRKTRRGSYVRGQLSRPLGREDDVATPRHCQLPGSSSCPVWLRDLVTEAETSPSP